MRAAIVLHSNERCHHVEVSHENAHFRDEACQHEAAEWLALLRRRPEWRQYGHDVVTGDGLQQTRSTC